MKKVFFTKGLPGSGKSTWAKEYIKQNPETVRVNKDDLRAMLHNGKFTGGNEKQVLRIRDCIIMDAIEHNRNVIVDDTNLKLKHQVHIEELIAGKAEFIVIPFLHVPLEKCIENDLKRLNSVGEKVIRKMDREWRGLDNQTLDPMIFGEDLPFCIIFDIDGTLSHVGDRSPYDSRECAVDLPNKSIIALNAWARLVQIEGHKYFSNKELKIVLLSGRKEEAREATETWMKDHGVVYDELYMRETADDRRDSIVKEELFNTHIRDKYNVIFIVDDRQQVVDMWRDLGITCLQTNWADF